jgi:hypothetical protein
MDTLYESLALQLTIKVLQDRLSKMTKAVAPPKVIGSLTPLPAVKKRKPMSAAARKRMAAAQRARWAAAKQQPAKPMTKLKAKKASA